MNNFGKSVVVLGLMLVWVAFGVSLSHDSEVSTLADLELQTAVVKQLTDKLNQSSAQLEASTRQLNSLTDKYGLCTKVIIGCMRAGTYDGTWSTLMSSPTCSLPVETYRANLEQWERERSARTSSNQPARQP